MKKYKHNNSIQTSREFYINELKNNKNNLNLSENRILDLDHIIDKWLSNSYKFYAPFFEDEDTHLGAKNLQHNTPVLDNNFNTVVDDPSPKRLTIIFSFFNSLYLKVFAVKKITANQFMGSSNFQQKNKQF